MSNMIQDLNVLTNIPEKTFSKLSSLIQDSISSTVWEDANAGCDITEIDLDFGKLFIKHNKETSEVKYHFEPCDVMRRQVKRVLKSNSNPITLKLNTSLQNRFLEVYKDIC